MRTSSCVTRGNSYSVCEHTHEGQLHFDFVALENSLSAVPALLTSLASVAIAAIRACVVVAEDSSLTVPSRAVTDFSSAVVCVGNSLFAELTTAFALESTFLRSASNPLTPDCRFRLPSACTDFSSSLTCEQKAGLEPPQPLSSSRPIRATGSRTSRRHRRNPTEVGCGSADIEDGQATFARSDREIGISRII